MLVEPLLLGLALGLQHALEPDHLAAITTLVSDGPSPRAAASTGAAWGLGHALAVVLLGGALIALGVRVPPRVAIALDLAVALMLIALGARAVLSRRAKRHEHPRSGVRGLLIGFVHGASGTAAITLVCVTKLRSASVGAAVAFLTLFALGSLLSMSAMSGLLAAPLGAVAKRSERSLRALRIGGGVLAFAAAIAVAVAALRAGA